MYRTGAKGADGKLIIAYELNTGISNVGSRATNLLSVYPNPANDKLFIQTNGISILKIELVDFTGKLVYTSNSLNQNNGIDISGLANGIYFVKAYTANRILTTKVIKK
jgi:hypothetical protein